MSGILEKGAKGFQSSWSETDLDLLRVYYGNVSVSWLCGKLNKTKASVTVKAFRLGLTRPREIDLFAPNL
jgi:hypothetical protein